MRPSRAICLVLGIPGASLVATGRQQDAGTAPAQQQAVVLFDDQPALPSCRCKITKPVEPTILLGKRVSIRWDKHEKLDGKPTVTPTWHTGVVTAFRNADLKHQVRAHHQHQQGGC